MTPKQLTALHKCSFHDPIMPGMALMFAVQAGYRRQVNWLLDRKLIRSKGGRLVITRSGRKILDYQTSR